jgi:hypothetical protein
MNMPLLRSAPGEAGAPKAVRWFGAPLALLAVTRSTLLQSTWARASPRRAAVRPATRGLSNFFENFSSARPPQRLAVVVFQAPFFWLKDVDPVDHGAGRPLVGRDGDAVGHAAPRLAVAREGFERGGFVGRGEQVGREDVAAAVGLAVAVEVARQLREHRLALPSRRPMSLLTFCSRQT